jgi:hypothetical protein
VSRVSYMCSGQTGCRSSPTPGWPERHTYKVAGRSNSFKVDGTSGKSDILHLKTFHPRDDWYGLSPLEAAQYSVDIKGHEVQNLFICQQTLSEFLQKPPDQDLSKSKNLES